MYLNIDWGRLDRKRRREGWGGGSGRMAYKVGNWMGRCGEMNTSHFLIGPTLSDLCVPILVLFLLWQRYYVSDCLKKIKFWKGGLHILCRINFALWKRKTIYPFFWGKQARTSECPTNRWVGKRTKNDSSDFSYFFREYSPRYCL